VSIGLVVALVGLTSLTLAVLLLPLLARQRRAAGREAYNLAVYRDQLAELERDLERGQLDGEQAEAARAEIGRRILALGLDEANVGTGARHVAAAVAAVLLLPVAALLLYARLGSPTLPDQPFAERRGAAARPMADKAAHLDMQEALAKLRAHLQKHPDDLTGQLLLARSELGLGRYKEAAEAYGRAAEMSGHRPNISADWGEAQVLAAGGAVTLPARGAFTAALKDPENAPRARYYLALAQLQQGDPKAALQAWVDLEADSPTGAEWLPLLRQRIAEAAGALGIDPATLKTSGAAARADVAAKAQSSAPSPAPSPSAVAAAAQASAGASPEEREAMINAMVERLAARLEQQPDDVEGWSRLGRSYMVLHRPDKAREAYARALRLRPDDSALKQALADAATQAAGQPGLPSR
jgi:cytochrome c-type biogenesis protein CcmH